jgi:hypothetical protein
MYYAPFLLAHSSDWRIMYVFTMNLLIGSPFSCSLWKRGFTATCFFSSLCSEDQKVFLLTGGQMQWHKNVFLVVILVEFAVLIKCLVSVKRLFLMCVAPAVFSMMV